MEDILSIGFFKGNMVEVISIISAKQAIAHKVSSKTMPDIHWAEPQGKRRWVVINLLPCLFGKPDNFPPVTPVRRRFVRYSVMATGFFRYKEEIIPTNEMPPATRNGNVNEWVTSAM